MTESEYPAYIDRRDREVVSRMTEGKVYGHNQLVRAYKAYTDIRNDDTAGDRVVSLFQSPCMEFAGTPGQFVFIGTDTEDDIL